MDSKLPTTGQSTSVQEFEPLVETVQEEDCDIILLYLPGFRKEQLRVQLTRTRKLIISGEHRLEQGNILSRFRKEFPVSTNVEANQITAKFEGNILFIRQPKLITPEAGNQQEVPIPKAPVEPVPIPKPPVEPVPIPKPPVEPVPIPKPPVEPSSPQKPVDQPQPDKKAEEQPERKDASNANPVQQLNERIKQGTKAEKDVPGEAQDKENDQVDAEKERAGSVANNSVSEGSPTEDGKVGTKESEKQASDSVNNATNMKGEAEDGGRKTLDNYRQSVGGLARKLKKPRKVMNFLVVILMALVLGIYITNLIKSWNTDETAALEL